MFKIYYIVNYFIIYLINVCVLKNTFIELHLNIYNYKLIYINL